MKDNLSKRTIYVFLLLTIFISVLSTWTLIDSLSQADNSNDAMGIGVSGQVTVEIQEKPEFMLEDEVT